MILWILNRDIVALCMKKAGPFSPNRKLTCLWLLFDFWVLASMDIHGKRSFETEGKNAPQTRMNTKKKGLTSILSPQHVLC